MFLWQFCIQVHTSVVLQTHTYSERYTSHKHTRSTSKKKKKKQEVERHCYGLLAKQYKNVYKRLPYLSFFFFSLSFLLICSHLSRDGAGRVYKSQFWIETIIQTVAQQTNEQFWAVCIHSANFPNGDRNTSNSFLSPGSRCYWVFYRWIFFLKLYGLK